jgi:fluoride exporter
MMKLLCIAIGGAVGSLLRYGLSGAVYSYSTSIFPWGTLSVNLVGSLVIGLLWGLFEVIVVSTSLKALLLVGVLGGFTTFSTFTLETFSLLRDGEVKMALLNIFLSNGVGIVLVFAGYFVARQVILFMR